MGKGTLFIGQPMFGQLISLIDKPRILRISREMGGDRGGRIVCQGTPEEVAQCKESYTGKYLSLELRV